MKNSSLVNHVLATFALTMTFATSLAADPYEDAVAAYEEGDYVSAYRLQLPLAEKGLAKAQVNLGIMFAHGRGVPQDYAEAAKWFLRAADQGDAFAQHNLGVFYQNGQGVLLDRAEALRWFRMAADQGLADAQYDLGRMYAEGRGVQQDPVRACMWLSLSADQGYEKALVSRNLVKASMTAAQITEAEKLAREWKLKAKPPQ